MKTAVYCSVFTLVSFWSLIALGQACHNENNNGGGYPNAQPGVPPYGEVDPYATGGANPYYSTPEPNANLVPAANITPAQLAAAAPIAAAAATPAGPSAKITVIAANAGLASNSKPATGSGKLRIVADEPAVDERIVQLAGTWKAVARRGAGELTTVELVLDNRGWAELTVPGSDGKPTTTKSRVNLENEELRLTGSDKVVSLGKLVNVSSRQMVLELAEGTMTFVKI